MGCRETLTPLRLSQRRGVSSLIVYIFIETNDDIVVKHENECEIKYVYFLIYKQQFIVVVHGTSAVVYGWTSGSFM